MRDQQGPSSADQVVEGEDAVAAFRRRKSLLDRAEDAAERGRERQAVAATEGGGECTAETRRAVLQLESEHLGVVGPLRTLLEATARGGREVA